jgi:hypothetical protein
MGKRDDRFIIILDLDKVFSADELGFAKTAADPGDAVEAAA